MTSLTQHLLSLQTQTPYESATKHPFLLAAARGSLDHDTLGLYLSQDRIYAAHAYPRFIGALIASIPYSNSHPIGSPAEQQNNELLNVLVFALTNIVTEVNFFGETAKEWGLKIEGHQERKATRDYTAEMARLTTGPNSSFTDALVFLWGMEKCYLDAWTGVNKSLAIDTATSSALRKLSENWSCPPFVAFVDRLAKIVDDLQIEPDSAAWKSAEDTFSRMVELEAAFWPDMSP
ncbi:heme oxygenase-like protein [Cylindrobasidium torrendii FP15055 ss-10]|uniref:Heme oxygenase-like protein n=1 Tax=Cylindrobasidium torrendii FP15055 ss-10 TaxID=1314674 RepID=A0A0D7B7U9_9AGAR|nr:heme oxygenase-like protein [Cylindrobasidium torrendii FP15055 ss-10]